MNKTSLNSKVALVEIAFSLLIIAFSGIIMVNCFAIARFTQVRANDKRTAGLIIQSDFEIIKSLNTKDEMYSFLEESYISKEDKNSHLTYTKYYNEDWDKITDRENSEYVVTVNLFDEYSTAGNLIKVNIMARKEEPYPFTNKGQDVFSIESKKFFPLGGSYGQ